MLVSERSNVGMRIQYDTEPFDAFGPAVNVTCMFSAWLSLPPPPSQRGNCVQV